MPGIVVSPRESAVIKQTKTPTPMHTHFSGISDHGFVIFQSINISFLYSEAVIRCIQIQYCYISWANCFSQHIMMFWL